MKTVVSVIDAIETIQADHAVGDQSDLSDRVRQVFVDQRVPLDEAILKQALDSTRAPTHAVFPAPNTSSHQIALVDIIAGMGLAVFAVAALFLCITHAKLNREASSMASSLIASTHVDQTAARKILTAPIAAENFADLGVTWTFTGTPDHPSITLHPLSTRLARALAAATKSTSDIQLAIAGTPFKTEDDLSRMTCRTTAACASLSITRATLPPMSR